MKKKKLLILALAAFSSVAVVAVGCGNDSEEKPEHTHAYTWQSDDDYHWEECTAGDDRKDSSAHIDVVINATQADGEDGLCDVCGRRLKKTVMFDLNGKGETAPAAQKVEYGSTAEEPATVYAEEYFVVGWYTDAECSEGNEYDFDSTVTADITLYAKWGENTTEGESAKYAYELNKGVQNLQAIGESGKLYYRFTAESDGRYTISLGGGNSAKCRFTTDKDDDTYYGNGCAAIVKNLDLDEGDEIIIIVSCEEELAEGAKVTALVNDCTNEDLPEDRYPAGEYANTSMSLEINRDNKTVTFYGNDYPYTYVGGKTDILYFTQTTFMGDVNYTLKYGESGVYVLSDGDKNWDLVYQAPQDPIDLAKFTGKYEPDGDGGDGITEIVIYPSGSGYFIQNNYKTEYDTTYYNMSFTQKSNTLNYGQYSITVNLDADGNAESINISGGSIDGVLVYDRVGDSGAEIPKKLLIDDGEYIGSTKTLIKYPSSSTIGGWGVTITDYDFENDIYDISVGGTPYKLAVIDDTTVELYDENDNLVDTLEKYVPTFSSLPDGEDEVDTSTVKKNMYLYKAAQSGWYKIEWQDESLKAYYNLNASDPSNIYYGVEVENGESVYLEQDAVVGLYLGGYAEVPAKIAVTVSKSEAPAGRSEDNPLELENGEATVKNMDNVSVYYFSYTAPAAGDYLVAVSYVSYDYTYYNLHYTIGNKDYGYTNESGWVNISSNDPYAKIVLEKDQVLIIAVDRKSGYSATVDSLNVSVFEDYSATASNINVAENVSGTLANGNYMVSDLSVVPNAIGIKLTSSQDIAVTVLGKKTTAKEIFISEEQLARGFKLEGAATVNYSVLTVSVYVGVYESASWWADSYPVTLAVAEDFSRVIYTVEDVVYEAELTKNGNTYSFEYVDYSWSTNVTFTIDNDGSIHIEDEGYGTATLISAEEVGEGITYADSSGYYVFTFESELADMQVGDKIKGTFYDGQTVVIEVIKTGDNAYSYDSGDGYAVGTFTLGDGSIDVTDDYYGAIALNRK